MPTSTTTADFLTELLALCIKHDVHIGGCGCCGSPWVASASPGAVIGEALTVRSQRHSIDGDVVHTYTDNTASLRLADDTALTVRLGEDGSAVRVEVEGDNDGAAP